MWIDKYRPRSCIKKGVSHSPQKLRLQWALAAAIVLFWGKWEMVHWFVVQKRFWNLHFTSRFMSSCDPKCYGVFWKENRCLVWMKIIFLEVKFYRIWKKKIILGCFIHEKCFLWNLNFLNTKKTSSTPSLYFLFHIHWKKNINMMRQNYPHISFLLITKYYVRVCYSLYTLFLELIFLRTKQHN